MIDSPVRLTANGNGEVKCVVYAYCYEEAKRGLQPYASSIVGSYPFISAFGAQINVHALEDICRLPFVRAIAAHTTVTALDGDFSNPKTPPQSSNFSDPKTPPPTPTPTSSLTSPPTSTQPPHNGRGVAVAVIDTGIMPHLDFTVPTRRIAHFHDFISGKPDPYDDNGHGSAVAGLVIGSGALSAGAVTGSATHAEVIALKAMNSKGEGSAFRILEAMQWVYEMPHDSAFACLSCPLAPRRQGRTTPSRSARKRCGEAA